MTRKQSQQASVEKISDRIAFLIEPIKQSLSPEAVPKVAKIACVVWNASLLTISKRQQMLDKVANELILDENNVEGKLAIQSMLDNLLSVTKTSW